MAVRNELQVLSSTKTVSSEMLREMLLGAAYRVTAPCPSSHKVRQGLKSAEILACEVDKEAVVGV
ncbi:hypothetical protein CBOM_07576 [Ceraceosorus bombacis]|uniref:Uncharacterized protein n=1 Tax=Ceraceosorus bombacis TaxID=401625 RepID=A0A0P1BFL7_9BASI|nr:hypothetical protein CBOM_07576 [Ceraceosorus bombacis]